jgi:serine/threonine protein kinase
VYEAGNYQGKPYLVFEYVDGNSLRDLLKNEGAIPVHRAITLMSQILAGVAYAHQKGIIHRDLKPSNIMIDGNDVPRIMDFGISVIAGTEKDTGGTYSYMSPEHFSKPPVGFQSDIFSLGLVLYEMLTGQLAFSAPDHISMLYKIAFEAAEAPSARNKTVDRKLDLIVLKALEKKPEARHAGALEMKKALDGYLSPDESDTTSAGSVSQSGHSTVEFLLRRMRHKKDFPAFSQHVLEINQKASTSSANLTSASQLAGLILKDYSLTNKLLRLVNSAFYGHFAGKISTVSRAVVVLGFEQVRLAAASLILFDHLQNQDQAVELKDMAVSSFMSGLVAKELAGKMGAKSIEESFICSMLHNLGKHLVIFYFSDEYNAIKMMTVQKGVSELQASRSVLGVSYEEVGMAVLKAWNFPTRVVSSLNRIPEGKVEKPRSDVEALRSIANFSNELCEVVKSTQGSERTKALTALSNRFQKVAPVSDKDLINLLTAARNKIEKYSDVLGIDVTKSDFLRSLVVVSDESVSKAAASPAGLAGQRNSGDSRQVGASSPADLAHRPDDNLDVLINGIQEITNFLLEDYQLNDVMFMILETIYRGFAFNHVIFCMLDMNRTKMGARYAFGVDIQSVSEFFGFRITNAPTDVFNVALFHGKDIVIEDSEAAIVKRLIPDWYRRNFMAPSFLIYPIIIKDTPLGLFYADKSHKGSIISGAQLNYMKTLRNQAIMAIKQKL